MSPWHIDEISFDGIFVTVKIVNHETLETLSVSMNAEEFLAQKNLFKREDAK